LLARTLGLFHLGADRVSVDGRILSVAHDTPAPLATEHDRDERLLERQHEPDVYDEVAPVPPGRETVPVVSAEAGSTADEPINF
jgi:hypothetical protein